MKDWQIILLVVLLIVAVVYSIYCYNSKTPKQNLKKAAVATETVNVQNQPSQSTEYNLNELRNQL